MFSIINIFYVSSIIAFYIAFQFILLTPINDNKKIYISFSILSLCVGVYQFYSAVYYDAQSINEVIFALKIQLYAAMLFFVVLYVFLSEYTSTQTNRRVVIFLAVIFGIGSLMNFVLPYGLRFETINSVSTFSLPWGEVLRTYYGKQNLWLMPLRMLAFGILIWGIWKAIVHLKTSFFEAIGLIGFILLMCASIASAWMIDNHKWEFFYTAGFAFFFLVLGMKVSLILRLIKQKKELEITTAKLREENILRQKAQEDLIFTADHDDLTGLPNRRVVLERLDQAIKQAEIASLQVAVLLLDIDHFREVNDSLGHIIGDRVLRTIADKLKNHIREADTLARLGGDEFCILIPLINTPEDAMLYAKKLLTIYDEPIMIDGHDLFISCSIGISVFPYDGMTPIEMLRNVDSAMYKAKQDRNNYQFYTEDMTKHAIDYIALENDLRRALENEEFIVYYQPQIDGRTDRLIGLEALIRWNHPEKGIVSPGVYIPFATKKGLIIAIDRYVLKVGMHQLKNWYDAGLNPGVLAFNLTYKQMIQSDFIDYVNALMQQTQCHPEWLEFEVTEGEIMERPEEAIHLLQQLHEMGIKIAIDDFGTGYSSLSYLKKLPVDKLKIDQSFVRDLPNCSEDVAVVNAIIALAESLNLEIIAEGVETDEQKEFLVENGCNDIQGYLYGRPMSVNLMTDYLNK